MVEYGKLHANIRSLVTGYSCHGWRDLIIGDIDRANKRFSAAIQISTDPWYSQFPKLALCFGSISNGRIEDALPLLDQLIEFSDDNGAEFVGEPARFFKALTSVLDGRVQEGLAAMETLLAEWKSSGSRLRCLTCGYVMAQAYYQVFQGAMQAAGDPESPQVVALADQSIMWYRTCVADAEDMGAQAMHGQSLLGLGQVLADLGQSNQAREVLARSIDLLESTGAGLHLKKAKTLIDSIPPG